MKKCLICQQMFQNEYDILDLILPYPIFPKTICLDCKLSFKKVQSVSHCKICSHLSEKCNECQKWSRYHLKHQSLYIYNDFAKNFLTTYKLKGNYEFRYCLVEDIYQYLRKFQKYGYIFVPIPVKNKTYQKRGFNQVTSILNCMPVNIDVCLLANNKIDQKEKNREERLQMKQMFSLNYYPKSSKICLVDDLYTTGRTITHAYSIFQQHGIDDICSFSIFRA